MQVSLEDELSTDFQALAPDRAVYEARHMRVVPKQALNAEADLRAALAELRWTLGGLASYQLPGSVRAISAAGAERRQEEHQEQQQRRDDAEGTAAPAPGTQAAGLQADSLAGHPGNIPEGLAPAEDNMEEDVSSAAADTAHLAYLLLGESSAPHYHRMQRDYHCTTSVSRAKRLPCTALSGCGVGLLHQQSASGLRLLLHAHADIGCCGGTRGRAGPRLAQQDHDKEAPAAPLGRAQAALCAGAVACMPPPAACRLPRTRWRSAREQARFTPGAFPRHCTMHLAISAIR